MSRKLGSLTALALLLLACGPSSTSSASPSPPTPAGPDACHVDGQTYCALNPAVTQTTIRQTICAAGWTATVRPPTAYTDTLKRQQLAEFASQHQGDPQWTADGVEEDHRMPLDLGGAPRDPQNLSPEVRRQSTVKDVDEAALGGSRGKVCQGDLTLAQAQLQLATRWLAVYPNYSSAA